MKVKDKTYLNDKRKITISRLEYHEILPLDALLQEDIDLDELITGLQEFKKKFPTSFILISHNSYSYDNNDDNIECYRQRYETRHEWQIRHEKELQAEEKQEAAKVKYQLTIQEKKKKEEEKERKLLEKLLKKYPETKTKTEKEIEIEDLSKI